MARTKEFDPEAAVGAALGLFWARGYEATSLSDLEQHLGIGRGSLYATFGSKHALYLRALDRYRAEQTAGLLDALAGARASGRALKPTLRRLLEAQVADSLDDPERRGCFFVNATGERAACDPEVARRVADNLAGLEATFTGAIRAAQRAGEVAPDKDARALARFLTMAMQGLRVAAKASPDRAALRDMVRLTLAALD